MTRQQINRGRIESLRKSFTAGTRVVLIRMEDPQAPPIGTLGTVAAVDDIGTIHVAWDNGSSLGVALGSDACRVITCFECTHYIDIDGELTRCALERDRLKCPLRGRQ